MSGRGGGLGGLAGGFHKTKMSSRLLRAVFHNWRFVLSAIGTDWQGTLKTRRNLGSPASLAVCCCLSTTTATATTAVVSDASSPLDIHCLSSNPPFNHPPTTTNPPHGSFSYLSSSSLTLLPPRPPTPHTSACTHVVGGSV